MGTHPIFESDFDCLTEIMIFSIACILFATVNAADQHETEQFKVIPGGEEHTHTGSMEMTIGVNADKSAYSCNIARPSGTTYLFFESYEIKVEGGSIEHFEVYGNEKRRLLSGEARTSGNSKLQAGNDFNHELASASVIVRSNKEEL